MVFLTPPIKQLTEAALNAELEQHLESDPEPNRKNGTSKRTVKSSVGQFELETPRDRSGTFEPQLVKKNQTKLTAEFDQKVLSMFALGMSYRDIRGHVQEMCGVEISEATITGVTDQLIPELKGWQSRSFDTLYPFTWLDAIHYKSRKVAVMLVKPFILYSVLISKVLTTGYQCSLIYTIVVYLTF